MVWQDFYNYQPRNGAGPILTAPEPTLGRQRTRCQCELTNSANTTSLTIRQQQLKQQYRPKDINY